MYYIMKEEIGFLRRETGEVEKGCRGRVSNWKRSIIGCVKSEKMVQYGKRESNV